MRRAVFFLAVAVTACGAPAGRSPAPAPGPGPTPLPSASRPGTSVPASYPVQTVAYTFSATSTTEWLGDTIHEPRRTDVTGALHVTRKDPVRASGTLSLDTVVYTVGDAPPDSAVRGGAVIVSDSELDALSCDRIGAIARAALPAFLPRMPEQLRSDARWSDTLVTTACTGRARGTTRIVNEYHLTQLTDTIAQVERTSSIETSVSADSLGTSSGKGTSTATMELETTSRVLRSIDVTGATDFDVAVAGGTRRYRQTSHLSAHAVP